MRMAVMALCLAVCGCSMHVHVQHRDELIMDPQGNDWVIKRGDRTVVLRQGASLGHMDVKEEQLDVEADEEAATRVTIDFATGGKTFIWDRDTVTFAGHTYELTRPGTYELDAEGNLAASPR